MNMISKEQLKQLTNEELETVIEEAELMVEAGWVLERYFSSYKIQEAGKEKGEKWKKILSKYKRELKNRKNSSTVAL